MALRKPIHIRTKHIHIEIRPPTGKELDLDDEFDIKTGMQGIWKEWRSAQEEVNEVFRVFEVSGKVKDDRNVLP